MDLRKIQDLNRMLTHDKIFWDKSENFYAYEFLYTPVKISETLFSVGYAIVYDYNGGGTEVAQWLRCCATNR